MCTNITESVVLNGSAKTDGEDWFEVTAATVYFDHPVDSRLDHSLNIDIPRHGGGPGARIALELDPESARALVQAIQTALASAP